MTNHKDTMAMPNILNRLFLFFRLDISIHTFQKKMPPPSAAIDIACLRPLRAVGSTSRKPEGEKGYGLENVSRFVYIIFAYFRNIFKA